MKTLYIVRHCKATGQAPDAPLTPEGEQQALRLADQLASCSIERIISSPFVRAVDSIAPLAQRIGLPIVTDDRLIERVLSTDQLDDWMTALRSTFDDLDLAFTGGESSRVATQRAVELLDSALTNPVRTTAIVTHGNLMTLLLKHLDPEVGFTTWQQLQNPDVYHVEVEAMPVTVHHLVRMSV